MVEKYGHKSILARFEANKKTFFRGVIITRKNSPIKSLSDIEGKRFAFGDPNSTMSHVIPRFMLLEAGITLKKLGSHSFIKNHCNVALGVLIGDYDAGAIKEEVFNRYEDRGLKAIARTPFIPEYIFVADDNLSAKTVQTLREALYNLKNETNGKEILSAIKQNLTGLVPCEDANYKNLRKIMRTLEEQDVKL
jgi:phosphonate transport system substrate-binding protein